MKAFVLHRYGSLDGLSIEEVAKPVPGEQDVLIKIEAVSVNDWDWSLVRGKPFYIRLLCGLFKPKVKIPGLDIAGRIIAVGPKVTEFRIGDPVYGDLSESGFGGFAEYVSAPVSTISRKPEGMSFVEAAAIPHAAMLALQGLRDLGRIKTGQSVLINGAGGGVGTLGVQIAKAMGAQQVTGVDSAAKAEVMRSVGFDFAIDYQEHDFTRSSQRYDVILDAKTDRSVFRYLHALKPGGIYVTVGGLTSRLMQVALLAPVFRLLTKKTTHLLALKPNSDMRFVNNLFEAGKFRAVIDGPYPFTQLREAVKRFGEGIHQGKIVLTMGNESHDQADH